MRYSVWIEGADGGGRLTLTETADGERASELVKVLVGADEGASYQIGVSVAQGEKGHEAAAAGGQGGRQAAAQTRPRPGQ